ncbi:transposase [Streptomyces coeruleorubidus]|uniref:transposase n=1 Tax=Streptomyces coeruleorubidus TaxID=116188 RepID=UPI003794B898
MDALRVPRTCAGRAPPREPDVVIADKAYSSRAIRQSLRGRGIRAVIPERTDQKANRIRAKKPAAGHRPSTASSTRPETWSNAASTASSSSARSPPASTLATRYKAGGHLAALILWLREPTQAHLS